MSLTTTTLSEAITPNDVVLVLASTSGVVAGKMLGIESEIALVTEVIGLNTRKVRVQRGVDGTASASHAASVTVSVGVPDDFALAAPSVPIVAPSGTVAVGAGPGANPSFQVASSINPFDQTLNTTSSPTFAAVTSPGAVTGASFKVGATAGATGGTFTTITSITVTNGIVTAISGT